MSNYKCTIDGKLVKTVRINVSDTNDKARCQLELNKVMAKMKEQGYKHCQITTIFDTNNLKNEFRSGKFVDIGSQDRPSANLYINIYSQAQRKKKPKKQPKKKIVPLSVFMDSTNEDNNKNTKKINKKDHKKDSDDEDSDDGDDGDDGYDGDDGDNEYLVGANAPVSGYSAQ